MSDVLYTKYNSLRKPEYQLKTSIIKEESGCYACKVPLTDAADQHLCAIKANYVKTKALYKNIKVLPYTEEKDGLRFEFLQGRSLERRIDFVHDELDVVVQKVAEILQVISEYRPDCLTKFEKTL